VADLFYEKDAAARAGDFLRGAVARGVRVLVADGGRPFAGAIALEELWTGDVPVGEAVEGVASRTVRVGEMRAEALSC
jgi:predicted nicotinamide N-methyase